MMKQKIEKWYKQGLWSAEMVYKAVEKGILTEKEYQEIINQEVLQDGTNSNN